jgi:hypothetical protein
LPASPAGVDDRAVSVTGLGAWCDFVTEDEYRQRLVRDGGARKGPLVPGDVPVPSELPSWPGEAVEDQVEDFKQGISFDVHEFADLDDGRRLTLHEERGFTTSGQWRHLTLENLERDVRTTVLPDDDDTQDEHPWEWLAGLLHARGVEATAEELRLLPYGVEFSERLRARLGAA